ncbi:terminase large subunit domain-containing protein [Lysinibacillus fusiformis]|uniref:terminase large subunit domain-containing protein n=1 Tax=Lysinibacillus fusiformis TaxID=28031 RepID=UPI003D013181
MPTLNKEKIELLAIEARKELACRSYHDYAEYVHHGHYKHYPHTRIVCDELQEIAEGKQKFILIEMPPRHGKSMTVTETFPSYYIGRNPDKRIITAAYSDGLATKFGRMNRNKFNEFAPKLFDIKLSEASAANKDWAFQNAEEE